MYFMPKTGAGKKSLTFLLLFIFFFGVFLIFVAFGQKGGRTFFANPLLSVPVVLAWICGAGAFFSGVISMIKFKESSVMVIISVLVGLLTLVQFFAEIFSPH